MLPSNMFILRWYKEVNRDGKELSGYQNKECAAYKLTLNNDGVPFRWTPNVQLITKVYLKKHLSQARTYTLNKKDVKMITTAMVSKIK
jgi:hypothetical protein